MKCGNLKFLEPSGPLQACNGTALPLLKKERKCYEVICSLWMNSVFSTLVPSVTLACREMVRLYSGIDCIFPISFLLVYLQVPRQVWEGALLGRGRRSRQWRRRGKQTSALVGKGPALCATHLQSSPAQRRRFVRKGDSSRGCRSALHMSHGLTLTLIRRPCLYNWTR